MSMGRNTSGGSGCGLKIGIAAVAIIGNIWLFSGSLFGDLEDNPIAWIIVLIAILIDIVLLAALFGSLTKRGENKTEKRESVTRTVPVPSINKPVTQSVSAERPDTFKLGQIKTKYSVPPVPSVPLTIEPLQKEMEAFQSLTVLQTVRRVVDQRREHIKQLVLLKEELNTILSCPGCSTEKEKIKYLNDNEDKLAQKKKEYERIIETIKDCKVVLLSKEEQMFIQLKAIFTEIASSQKTEGNGGGTFREFARVNAVIPGDLFETKQTAIELNFGAYRFYLLPDVVLAFHRNGEFVTAFEPMAMIIQITESRRNVYVSNLRGNGWSYRDNVIASDSTLVYQGNARSRWLHEKKSGGPDLRYSYFNNPRYEYRTDTYAFTEICIQIGHFEATYSASKAGIALKANTVVKQYCSLSHRLNSIPSFLKLLEVTAKKKDGAKALSTEYIRVCKDLICTEA